MPTTTIVFDLGGVLIDWNPRYVYRQLLESEAEVNQFLEEVATMDWNIQQDRGRTIAEGTRLLIERHPNHTELIEAYYGRWTEMLGGPIAETVEMLDELRQNGKYRLLALTNWSAETFPIAQKRYKFLGWFEGIVVSGVEQCIKPEPQIYQILFERYKLNPVDCLFIDDNENNVTGSISAGMPALHFDNPAQLRQELVSRGIL